MKNLKYRIENSQWKNNFTDDGIDVIIKHLENTGSTINDPCAIASSFDEYNTLWELYDDIVDKDLIDFDVDEIESSMDISIYTDVEYIKAHDLFVSEKDIVLSEDETIKDYIHKNLRKNFLCQDILEIVYEDKIRDYVMSKGIILIWSDGIYIFSKF